MSNRTRIRHTTTLAAALFATAALVAPASRAAHAEEPMKVVCTLGHLAAHAREIGGEHISVVQLSRGDQDPHFVQATPSLMNRANEASVYIELGLDLELWSERVLDGARNQQVRVGFPGHLYAATNCPVLERPAVLSRAQGDVHPNGNPHLWLNPINAAIEVRNIVEVLSRNDAARKDEYEKRGKAYADKLHRAHYGDALVDLLGVDTLVKLERNDGLADFLEKKKYKGEQLKTKLGGWMKKLEPYRGRKIITFHRDLSYFVKAYGIEVIGTLEPKPGVAPSPGHLSALEETAKQQKVSAVVCAPYQNVGLTEDFATRIGAPTFIVQLDCGATEKTQDYMGLMSAVVDQCVAAFEKGGAK